MRGMLPKSMATMLPAATACATAVPTWVLRWLTACEQRTSNHMLNIASDVSHCSHVCSMQCQALRGRQAPRH